MEARDLRQVLIAGGGIAGLTAALAFAERGWNVRLLERVPRIETIGAGIQLSPNATHILGRLGVLDRLSPSAARPRAVVLKDATTLRTLAQIPLGDAARWKAPYLVAHRADLQNALMACAAGHASISMTTGAEIDNASVSPYSIELTVNGEIAQFPGSLLVGADGVWSKVRKSCRPTAESRFSGELAWRTTIPADSPAGKAFLAIGASDCVTAFLHAGFHMVAYPVSSGSAVNLVAFTRGERIANNWSGKADPAILAKAMRGTSQDLARLVRESGAWTAYPIHTVDARGGWTAPNVALIGDAAHAMTPFAAQGAAMAIEDAATLAHHVSRSTGDLNAGLIEWERVRRPRVNRVTRRGAVNRLAWHAAGPVALARNLVLKMRSPESLAADLDWLYGWQMPGDDPAI